MNFFKFLVLSSLAAVTAAAPAYCEEDEEGSGKVTFDYMLNALKNGSGEAFSIVLDSDEGQYGQSISDKIVDRIVEHALNAMSRIINFFARRINKKK